MGNNNYIIFDILGVKHDGFMNSFTFDKDAECVINKSRGCGQKPGLPRASKGAESLYILKTKSILHYRFITNVVL